MKKNGMLSILAAGVLAGLISDAPAANWYDKDWRFRQKITINADKVATNLTNFPALVKMTNAAAGVFSKARVDGDDILFTAADGINLLDFEIEFYTNAGLKELEAWVRISSLPTNQDTSIYMYYGNPGASDHQNSTSVWDSNYVMVQHLNESAGMNYDSTTNSNDGKPYLGNFNLNMCETTNGFTGTSISLDTSGQYEGSACVRDTISSPVAGNWYTTTYSFASSTNLKGRYLNWFMKSKWYGDFYAADAYVIDTNGNWRAFNMYTYKFYVDAWRAFVGFHLDSGGTTSATPLDSSAVDRIEWRFRPKVAYAITNSFDKIYVYGAIENQGIGTIDGGAPFDGQSTYVDCSYNATQDFGTNSFSVHCWIKPSVIQLSQLVNRVRGDQKEGWFIRLSGEVLTAFVNNYEDPALACVSTTTVTTGNWYQVVMVVDRNAGKLRLFVNGTMEDEDDIVSDDPFDPSSSYRLVIGARTLPLYFFGGVIDEVRLSATSRNAGWIETSYNNQGDPGTFLTFGQEEQPPAGTIIMIR